MEQEEEGKEEEGDRFIACSLPMVLSHSGSAAIFLRVVSIHARANQRYPNGLESESFVPLHSPSSPSISSSCLLSFFSFLFILLCHSLFSFLFFGSTSFPSFSLLGQFFFFLSLLSIIYLPHFFSLDLPSRLPISSFIFLSFISLLH